MSKTSSDFGFFGDVNQTLKNWRFRAFTSYRGSKEKRDIMVCDLGLVDFDPFCVFLAGFVAFELQSSVACC